ncbi:MAG: hypothetical protein ACRBBV_17720 [Paracoccaceae bacterium]
MTVLSANVTIGEEVNSGLFGGNFLFHRDVAGEEGTYSQTVDDLGVTGLRFPGGAITEGLFDINNPDATTANYPGSGAEETIFPFSKFMQFAEESDRPVTIVLPTRHYLTEEQDELGHSFANVDEAGLRQFVSDTLSGYYGSPSIKSFEIGNEYWGIGDWDDGSMTTLEYARVASKMSEIIADELDKFPVDSQAHDVDIVVQIGTNNNEANLRGDYSEWSDPEDALAAIGYDYGIELDESYIMTTGAIDYTEVANAIMIGHFQEEGTIGLVDGIAAHVYGKGEDNSSSWYHEFDTIAETWGQIDQPIAIYVTEWNQKANTGNFDRETDFGLHTPAEMLDILEAMVEADVEEAHVWAIQHNTRTSLASAEGQEDLNIPGEFFRMMSGNLEGLRVLDANAGSRETELVDEGMEVHMFGGEERFVVYMISNDDHGAEADLDFSNIVAQWETATVTRLGVVEGDTPGNPDSRAQVTDLDADTSLEDGVIMEDLEPYEIIQIVLENPVYSPEMQELLGIVEDDPVKLASNEWANEEALTYGEAEGIESQEVQIEDLFISMEGTEHSVPDDDEQEEEGFDEDSSGFGALGELLGWLVGLAPLLAAMG